MTKLKLVTCTDCGDSFRDADNYATHKCSKRFATRAKQLAPERGRTHGSFEENAKVAFVIRDALRTAKGWTELTLSQRLAMEEIALKMARIVSGGAMIKEHWVDLAGYSALGEKDCEND